MPSKYASAVPRSLAYPTLPPDGHLLQALLGKDALPREDVSLGILQIGVSLPALLRLQIEDAAIISREPPEVVHEGDRHIPAVAVDVDDFCIWEEPVDLFHVIGVQGTLVPDDDLAAGGRSLLHEILYRQTGKLYDVLFLLASPS